LEVTISRHLKALEAQEGDRAPEGFVPDRQGGMRWPLCARTAIGIVFLAGASIAPAHAHWCDEEGPLTIVERTICAYPNLIDKDRELNDLYGQLGGARNIELKNGQRSWLNSRNACADAGCVERHYDERIRVLREMRYGPAGTAILPPAPPPISSAPLPSSPVYTPPLAGQSPSGPATPLPAEKLPAPGGEDDTGLGTLD
jgi:uncharacterized protein YecT (DUF1311 family)